MTVWCCSAPAQRASSAADLIPSLGAELRLTQDFLDRGLPVIGIGIGACILSTAAGGGAEEAPLRFTLDNARRVVPDALSGPFAANFPGRGLYARSPGSARRGQGSGGRRARRTGSFFRLRDNCFGFVGHPGIKSAMIEDLIMEFDEVPEGTAETLAELRAVQGEIAAALAAIMVGLVEMTAFDGAASLAACRALRTHANFSNSPYGIHSRFWNM